MDWRGLLVSKTLNVNHKQRSIAVLNLRSPYGLLFSEGKSTVINQENDISYIAACINCINPHCMRLDKEEITCSSFTSISPDMNLAVCPVDAIQIGDKRIEIKQTKCIGCGMCVQRCPVGALYLKSGKATHNDNPNAPRNEMSVTKRSISIQEEYLDKLGRLEKSGILRKENDTVMTDIYNKISHLSQEQQNILARNMMICLGGWASLSRQGNVYMRMDGFYQTVDQYGVVEIETGLEMLDVSRALLDDVAVVHARYGIQIDNNHPLAICLGLPNKRTDYWQVIKDILKITHLQINTVTFGMLLIFLWNLEEVNDYDRFYVDVDNSSLRAKSEAFLQRRIHISGGHLGILENTK